VGIGAFAISNIPFFVINLCTCITRNIAELATHYIECGMLSLVAAIREGINLLTQELPGWNPFPPARKIYANSVEKCSKELDDIRERIGNLSSLSFYGFLRHIYDLFTKTILSAWEFLQHIAETCFNSIIWAAAEPMAALQFIKQKLQELWDVVKTKVEQVKIKVVNDVQIAAERFVNWVKFLFDKYF